MAQLFNVQGAQVSGTTDASYHVNLGGDYHQLRHTFDQPLTLETALLGIKGRLFDNGWAGLDPVHDTWALVVNGKVVEAHGRYAKFMGQDAGGVVWIFPNQAANPIYQIIDDANPLTEDEKAEVIGKNLP